MRRFGALAAVAVVALITAACVPPLSTQGDTSSIQLVSSKTLDGWKYDYYRNMAYPCSVSGYQTFVIGTKIGSSQTAARPLWAFMHGGGAGYFDENGNPIPNANQKVEEGPAGLNTSLDNSGLLARVRDDAAGFRTLAVSYCSHEVYGGLNTPDPHNPNTTPDGKPRPTDGLIATKAAIQYAQALYPTTKTFLHGGSAGSAGAYYVAWAMQLQGIPPAGVVADASVVNVEAMQAGFAAGICTDKNDPAREAGVAARVHPDIANVNNEVDKLVASGRLTVPLLNIWNHGDQNTCGSPPVACPLHDGTTATLGMTDCVHEPLRRAIAAQGPTSRSMNLPLCVDADPVQDCSTHVVTNKGGLTNTDPSSSPDYLTTIMTWVHARLADA
ncbi:MAG TPA: hypothetical protein VGN59_00735 [Acidimicrobiia bacterium]|jgi:hypothetical protein